MSTFGKAAGDVLSGRFITDSAFIVVGAWASSLLTDYARDNVVDIGMTGGDVAYGIVGAIISLALFPRRFGRPLASGMVAGGSVNELTQMGVV